MRAAVATGHYLAKCIYHILKEGKPYEERGAEHFNSRHDDYLKKQLVSRLERLGYQVDISQPTLTTS